MAPRGISRDPSGLDLFLSIVWIGGAYTKHDFQGVPHPGLAATRVPGGVAHYGQGRPARRCAHEKSSEAGPSADLRHAREYRPLLPGSAGSSLRGANNLAYTSS